MHAIQTQERSHLTNHEKQGDARHVASVPARPVPLDPAQFGQVGGGGGAPRTTW